jgi:anti-anti-sigma factor
VATVIHSINHMRLSITTAAGSSVDFVRILGDVDMSDSVELGLAAQQLIDASGSTVYVDLAGTTYMGSTLLGFLVHLGNDGHARRPMVLCRPTDAARRMIHITGLDELASVRPDLPRQWPVDDSESATGQRSERWASA